MTNFIMFPAVLWSWLLYTLRYCLLDHENIALVRIAIMIKLFICNFKVVLFNMTHLASYLQIDNVVQYKIKNQKQLNVLIA